MTLLPTALLLGLGSLFIVGRHDISDREYIQLGRHYPAVVQLGGAGDATLIAPRALLTAAHVARAIENAGELKLRIGNDDYRVIGVVLHPLWRELGDHDVAVVWVDRPVGGVKPLELNRSLNEAGQVATLVGHGARGRGNSRQRAEDGRRRGATSRVDSATSASLYFSFDAPPRGTRLEGAPGRGDSGGPAVLTSSGLKYVAGISSAGFDGRLGPGTYGAVDVFTRVATHLAWIDSVRASPPPTSRSLPAGRDTTLPDSPAGLRYKAFLAAMRAGTDSAILSFVQEHFEPREYNSRPALIPNMKRLALTLRDATVDEVVQSRPLQLTVRLKTRGAPVTIELISAEASPHKLVDWRRFD